MKRILCLFLVVTLAFCIVACKPSEDNTDDNHMNGTLEDAMADFSAIIETNPIIDVDVNLLNSFFGTLAASEICMTGTIVEIDTSEKMIVIYNSMHRVDVWVDDIDGLYAGEKVNVIGNLDIDLSYSGIYSIVVDGVEAYNFSLTGRIISDSEIPSDITFSEYPPDLDSFMKWFINNFPERYYINNIEQFSRFITAIKSADIQISGTVSKVIADNYYVIKSGNLEINVIISYEENVILELGDEVVLSGKLLSIFDNSYSANFSLTDCIEVEN